MDSAFTYSPLHITSEGVGLDHITRAFKIEVEDSAVWNTAAHGFLRLPVIHEVKYG